MALTEERLSEILDNKLLHLRNELIASFQKDLTREVNGMKASMDTLRKSIKSNKEKAILNETRITALENIELPQFDSTEIDSSIEALRVDHDNMKNEIARCTALLSEKDEEIEDLRNRQMRKTLVFKGIKESDAEKSWDDTEQSLIMTIKEACTEFPDDAIERCHRVQKKRYSRTGSRDIVAQFYSWKDAEKVRQEFAKKNSRDRSFGVFCSQKYGPRTTFRQNLAMKLRKDLITSNEYAKAYVAYPAKLMVAKGKRDTNYTLHTDFSSHAVVTKKGELATVDSTHN